MKKRLDKSKFALFYWGLASENEKKEIFDSEESIQMLKDEWKKSKTFSSEQEPNLQKIKSNIDKAIAEKSKKNSFLAKKLL